MTLTRRGDTPVRGGARACWTRDEATMVYERLIAQLVRGAAATTRAEIHLRLAHGGGRHRWKPLPST
jgi:hypothetical protein